MTPEAQTEDLWSFSLRIYREPGVADACLWLQDRHALDVNVLLFCCWAAARSVVLDAGRISQVQQAIAAWRSEVIEPLRRVRRWMKANRDGVPGSLSSDDHALLRERIKANELDAERLEQHALETFAPDARNDTVAPDLLIEHLLDNTLGYLQSAAVAIDIETVNRLATLATAVSASDPESARNALLDRLTDTGGAQ